MIQSTLLHLLCINVVLNDIMVNFTKPTLPYEYRGEHFPTKYLVAEITRLNMTDLHNYLYNLERTVTYFNKSPNSTNCNVVIATFYAKVILARTLQDYKRHIHKDHNQILAVIRKCANIVSHFNYNNRQYGWQDYEYRLSELFMHDEPPFYSISTFNNGRLKKWLQNNYTCHKYSKELDDISLPKEKYVEIVARAEEFHIAPLDSDYCLSIIPYTPEPINLTSMQWCRMDQYCYEVLHSSPSISYPLSHRLLNVLIRHQIRRCYLKSLEDDVAHMDMLCAFMYREAVYLSRRGFFARDMFMEQIALCALLSYEEFHRKQWFDKISSWIDDHGCVQENPNYERNMTSYMIKNRARSVKEAQEMRKDLRDELLDECHHHPMALAIMVMAHGVRYAAYHGSLINLNEDYTYL